MDSLTQQLTFLREIDRLKSVIRQSPLLDRSRKENSAEHSWHLAMYAWLLAEHASTHVDVSRVIRMLLLHDIVEVDVGDTPIHGSGSAKEQAEREAAAAARLFGLLPSGQGAELLALWQEFEAATTEDAKFAKALDRFQPLLVNIFTEGGTWAESGVSLEQVLSRYGPVIQRGSPSLWAVCEQWVERHFRMNALKETYAALNRNDIDTAVKPFDPQIAWIEPWEYTGSATCQGREAVRAHLTTARGRWAEGSCEPERLVPAGDKIIVIIHVHVRLKDEAEFRDGRHAAVYTFRDGKAIEMRIFDDQRQAFEWAGVEDPESN